MRWRVCCQAWVRYDVVLDALGGETATRSVGVLRPGGVLISLVPGAEDTRAAAEKAQVRAVTLIVQHDQAGMRAIADLVDRGRLRAHVSATFPSPKAPGPMFWGDGPHHGQAGHHHALRRDGSGAGGGRVLGRACSGETRDRELPPGPGPIRRRAVVLRRGAAGWRSPGPALPPAAETPR
ncbi:zinc-binding dehydrogenase [Nonomuraea sp. NPDC050202]|uniref:zinc-binding dehydrogenase n=1 Tax=Nonomuraea sp. NPDC050202 TaxID=3155035 RepID=UPI0033FAC1CF